MRLGWSWRLFPRSDNNTGHTYRWNIRRWNRSLFGGCGKSTGHVVDLYFSRAANRTFHASSISHRRSVVSQGSLGCLITVRVGAKPRYLGLSATKTAPGTTGSPLQRLDGLIGRNRKSGEWMDLGLSRFPPAILGRNRVAL